MVQSQRPLLRDTAGESRKKLLGLQSACCNFCMKEDTGIIAAIILKLFFFFLCVEEMQDEFPELREVHALTERADHLEERRLYHSAREIYKDAVSKLLPLIESIMLFVVLPGG